ncbi:MAG TPA: hypothetical protein VKB23_10665 [Solirubrobacterales bacterium]|nr:hypothetical protein [Solirubrobacterales bacterium]
MLISELREAFQLRLSKFLWNEWGQMGVLAASSNESRWAADPEALLLLSFEVGREDPRLLEEVLDWLHVNERLISVQRLRNLVRDGSDRALVESVVGWLGQNRRRPRLGAKPGLPEAEQPQPFFRNSQLPVSDPDPAFLAQGFLKPRSEPSGKSQSPDLDLPINFAYRLRLLLGIGVRAEAVRVLLTTEAPRVDVQTLAVSTGYNKRNVQEGVSSLKAAGVLGSWEVGNEQRFEAPGESWACFLELRDLPRHVDWPQLFAAYRRVLRWLADPANQNLSDYMLASEARTLVEEISPDLRFAGVAIDGGGRVEESSYFERIAKSLLELGPI